MSSHHPIQRLCSLSIDRAGVPPNHCTDTPYRSAAGVQRWVCNRESWFPCLGWQKKTHWKTERLGGALALGGCCLVKKRNNQPIVGGNNGRDDGEGARLGQNIWGVLSLVQGDKLSDAKKYKNEICCGLRWLCNNISHSTTNQKHFGACIW